MSAVASAAQKVQPRGLPERSRVGVLTRAGHFEVVPRVTPRCGPGEVLVRLEGCGICGSSLPVWEGRPWFEYPRGPGVPGHEGWGHIEALGAEVTGLHRGQRVTFLAEDAFSEFTAVPASKVVPLPPELDGVPFPGEAIGCAMNIFRRAEVSQGQQVAIVGAGFLGLLLVELAVAAGARVYVLSRRRFARDLALERGAVAAFDTEDWWGNARRVVEQTGGGGCQRVIEATGLQFALDAATELVAEYGKIIVAGFHQDGLRQVNMQTWNWRAVDVISAHERDPERYRWGMEQAVLAAVSGRIHPQRLLTHEFPLEQLDAGFRALSERPDGFVKGWVRL